MNPYFRNPGTLLQDSPMRRLAGKEEPNYKKCHLHTPSIHSGAVLGADSPGQIFCWCIMEH